MLAGRKRAGPVKGASALPVLHEADARLDGWSCEDSAECCDFGRTGREPYVTAAEVALIEAEVARQGRKLPTPRADGRCPFLTGENRCSIYEARPLGCRTYFCERASGFGRFPRREIAPLPRALEDLSGGVKGRPLTRWLGPR